MTELIRVQRFLRLCLVLLAAGLFTTAALAEERPLRVCLVSGSLEYKSNESLADFQAYLEKQYQARCTRAFLVGKDEEHLPGLENLDSCDVMLLFTRRLKLSGSELEQIKKYCQSGKPIVGVRTASHAIQTWLDLDKEVLNGNYHGHYGHDLQTDITVLDAGKSHPALKGFTPFRSAGSLYKNSPLPEGNEVLMTGAIPEHTEPITWTHIHKGGRVFYTSLGHPQDFKEPSFRQMLAQSLYWAAGQTPRTK